MGTSQASTFFFFQAEDGIRDDLVTGVQTCALPISAFGGKIAQWIDVAAAIACQRHCRKRVVTASMDDLHFLLPIKVGMIVELRAQVNAAFRTSMEAGVRVESEDPMSGERRHACSAFLTFVAQDQNGRAVEVPPLTLENEEDKRRAADAGARRAIRPAPRQARRERRLAENKPS